MATVEAALPAIHHEEARGLAGWLTTVDHKRIGIMYAVSALVFFLVGGLEALLIRLQLARPDGQLVSADTYNQLFTMHGTTMVFLALMPLSAAFFNYLIPLLIGARDVAFPRLNAFSFWMFLLGGLFLNSSWLLGTAPDAGVRGSRPGSTSRVSRRVTARSSTRSCGCASRRQRGLLERGSPGHDAASAVRTWMSRCGNGIPTPASFSRSCTANVMSLL